MAERTSPKNVWGPTAGNDGALRLLKTQGNPTTGAHFYQPDDAEPLELAVRAARFRGLQVFATAPGRIALPTGFLPGAGYLALIADDPEAGADASQGPGAFKETILATLMKDARVVLCSAIPGYDAAAMAAGFIATGQVKRHAFILTGPRNHTAWT